MFGGVSHFFHYLQKTLWYCQAVPAPGTSLPHQFSVLLLLLSLRCKETPVYHTTSSTRAFAYQSISKFCPERHSTWIFTSSAALILSDLFSASSFFFNEQRDHGSKRELNVKVAFYFVFHSSRCRMICLASLI